VGGKDPAACPASSGGQIGSNKSSSPSFGAGVGVGIAIALGIAAVTAIVWWALSKKKRNKTDTAELNGSTAGYGAPFFEPKPGNGYYGPPSELHTEIRQRVTDVMTAKYAFTLAYVRTYL
jgi:hypothetical protein